jgi:plasmid stability protein
MPKRVTVSVSDELHHRVKLQAAKEGRTISDKLREFLTKWVETNEETQTDSTQEDKGLADVRAK